MLLNRLLLIILTLLWIPISTSVFAADEIIIQKLKVTEAEKHVYQVDVLIDYH